MIALWTTVALASQVDRGDELWCAGDYSGARKQWNAVNSEDLSEVALASYRKLLSASNLTWPFLGYKGDQSLAQCARDDVHCALANVDREIFLSMMGLPSDLSYAQELAQQLLPHLPTRAQSRLVWLGAASLDSLDGDALDAFGKCLQQHNGKYPRGPGGAYIGFGLYGGGRLGIGLNAGWTQPNIDQRGGELILSAAATTKQAGGLFVNYRSAGKVWFRANGSIQRLPFYRYVEDVPEFHLLDAAMLTLSPGYRWESAVLWGGVEVRADQLSDPLLSIGPTFGWSWRVHPTVEWTGDFLYTWIDYHHLRLDNRLIWVDPSGFAAMATLYAAPESEAPWWRMPTLGGGRILRTAPGHRWRDELIPSAVFEYRWRPEATVGVVAFSELAYAEDSLHGGGGLGLRIRMPPQPFNTIRIDVGYGDAGWNVLFGVEEFIQLSRF